MRRAPVTLVVLAALATATSGCGIQLRAEKVKIEVDEGSMRIVEPVDGHVGSGEVVIEIVNATSERRQFTLAKTAASPKAIPGKILDAYSYRDDSSVVAVTGVMRAAEVQLQFGSIPRPQPTKAKLHVYIHAGTPYLLFDRLGGYKQGVALKFEASS